MRQKCVNCKYFIKLNKDNIFEINGVCKGATKNDFYIRSNYHTQFNKCYLYEEKEHETNNKN